MPLSAENGITHDRENTEPARWRSTRFLLCYLSSAGLCVVFLQRVSLSMAIVCMVNHTAVNSLRHQSHQDSTDPLINHINTSGTDEPFVNSSQYAHSPYNLSAVAANESSFQHTENSCHQLSSTTEQNKEDGPFVWDKQTQGLLLSALYLGYTIMQIPGNYVIHRLGVRLMTGGSIVVMSVCHALCHPAAFFSPWAVLALRIVMGLSTATVIPAFYGLWGRWAPKAEQATLLGITFAGQMVALAAVFPLSALLCEYGFLSGWPSVFYVFGGVGIVWSAVWFFVMSDSPETHPRISPSERDYIVLTRASVTDKKQKLEVPWGSMVKSSCFWAIAVGHFVYDYGFFLMISNLPIFLYETMGFDIKSNGVISMLPYIALFLVLTGTGFLSDCVIRRRFLSVLAARKLFTIVAYITPAVLLVVMSHLPCDQTVALVTLLVVAVGVSGLAVTGGFFLNPYDIAPRYAVNICTATNTLSSVAGMVNPYLVAALTVDQTREQWQTVFYITSGLYVIGIVVFCVFAKAHVQPWACPPQQEIECQGLNKPDSHT